MEYTDGQADNQTATNNHGRRSKESRAVNVESLRFVRDKAALVGRSQIMTELAARIVQIANANLSVLVTGPTGAGKEVVARLIHDASARALKPFVALNCAAIPEPLLESELFGHEKGAFTGADARVKGKWEAASGGTLLLDEIGDAPRSFQAKILRVIQDGVVSRIGSIGVYSSNVRIIAATNRNLEVAVASGEFREDLYYRLKVVSINLPPLKDHSEDIGLLTEHFASGTTNRNTEASFNAEALALLSRYNWPGNVRELRNVVLAAVNLSHNRVIGPEDLPDYIRNFHPDDNRLETRTSTDSKVHQSRQTEEDWLYRTEHGRAFAMEMKKFKLWMIDNAIKEHGGNTTEAAKFLGLTRQGLYKIRKAAME